MNKQNIIDLTSRLKKTTTSNLSIDEGLKLEQEIDSTIEGVTTQIETLSQIITELERHKEKIIVARITQESGNDNKEKE